MGLDGAGKTIKQRLMDLGERECAVSGDREEGHFSQGDGVKNKMDPVEPFRRTARLTS